MKQSKGQNWNNCEYVDSNDSDLEQVVVVVESKEVGKQEEEEFSILVVDVRISSVHDDDEGRDVCPVDNDSPSWSI